MYCSRWPLSGGSYGSRPLRATGLPARMRLRGRRATKDHDTLESDLSTLQDESGSSTLESDVQDATTKLSDICDELSLYGGAFFEIYAAAC